MIGHAHLDDKDWALLDDFQHRLPLVPRPFRAIGEMIGLSETEVLARLHGFSINGTVSRIGAVLPPLTFGASTLAAMAVPAERLEKVAALVNARAEVNHNYERQHAFNLWFVVTAPNTVAVAAAIARIEDDTGLSVLKLPLVEQFHIDLGFPLRQPSLQCLRDPPLERVAVALTPLDERLAHLASAGLALVETPFAYLAAQAGCSEDEALASLGKMMNSGAIKRLGVIVRHHELGLVHNAMAVWNVPDPDVSAIGQAMARYRAVNLCYRRPRVLPAWPYNLFAMVHGRDRAEVLDVITGLTERLGLGAVEHAVLFSTRRFKQRGARYKDVA